MIARLAPIVVVCCGVLQAAEPRGLVRLVGQSAEFRYTPSGAPSGQWHKDGVAVPNAVSATLTIPSVSLADAGDYQFVGTPAASVVASLAVFASAPPVPPATVRARWSTLAQPIDVALYDDDVAVASASVAAVDLLSLNEFGVLQSRTQSGLPAPARAVRGAAWRSDPYFRYPGFTVATAAGARRYFSSGFAGVLTTGPTIGLLGFGSEQGAVALEDAGSPGLLTTRLGDGSGSTCDEQFPTTSLNDLPAASISLNSRAAPEFDRPNFAERIHLYMAEPGNNTVSIYEDQGYTTFPTGCPFGGTGTQYQHWGWEYSVSVPVGDQPSSLAVGHLDGDALDDLVVSNSGSDSLTVIRGNNVSNPVTIPNVGAGPWTAITADFNADTFLDIVVSLRDEDAVAILTNDGVGGFGPAQRWDLPAGCQPHGLAAKDFDADGWIDVAVACWGLEEVVLLGAAEPNEPPEICLAAASNATWQNAPIAPQTGIGLAEFSVDIHADDVDGLVALSASNGSAFADYAAIVRFNDQGFIDVRNGPVYTADAFVSYVAGQSYRVTMQFNTAVRRYTAWVQPPGQAEILLADNYAFRSEQSGVTSLANFGLWADTRPGAPPALDACLDLRTGDLAEDNAFEWGSFATDGAARTVSDDDQFVQSGMASIRLDTDSGFDTGVSYPLSGEMNFDASTRTHLMFWSYAANDWENGFQDHQPVVVLRSGAGEFRYEPGAQLTANYAWRLFAVPLAGGEGWTRTATGTPSLADIDAIEIHQDTWDYGFTIYYDGVRFVRLETCPGDANLNQLVDLDDLLLILGSFGGTGWPPLDQDGNGVIDLDDLLLVLGNFGTSC